jgi:hypothetical protein
MHHDAEARGILAAAMVERFVAVSDADHRAIHRMSLEAAVVH